MNREYNMGMQMKTHRHLIILLPLMALLAFRMNASFAQTNNWGPETITGTVTKSFSGTVNLNGKITVDGCTLTINNTSTTAPLYIKRNWNDNNSASADMFLIKNNGKVVIKETEATRVIFDGNGKTGRCFHMENYAFSNKSRICHHSNMVPQAPSVTSTSMSGMAIYVNNGTVPSGTPYKYSTTYKNTISLKYVNVDNCGDAKPASEAATGLGNTDCAIRLSTASYCPVTMRNCNITNNRGTKTYSGVFCAGGTTVLCVLDMENCTWDGNYSSGWGGAILWCGGNNYAADAVLEGDLPTAKAIIKNCTFTNNEAAYLGGAISNEGTVELQNNYFYNNHAKAGGAVSTVPFTLATNAGGEVCGLNLLGGNEFDSNYTTWSAESFIPAFLSGEANSKSLYSSPWRPRCAPRCSLWRKTRTNSVTSSVTASGTTSSSTEAPTTKPTGCPWARAYCCSQPWVALIYLSRKNKRKK